MASKKPKLTQVAKQKAAQKRLKETIASMARAEQKRSEKDLAPPPASEVATEIHVTAPPGVIKPDAIEEIRNGVRKILSIPSEAETERYLQQSKTARAGRQMMEEGLVMMCSARETDGPNRLSFWDAIRMWKRYQASLTTRHTGPM